MACKDIRRVLACWCVFIISTTMVHAMYLDLPNSGSKCVSEHIPKNVLVLLNYVLIDLHDGAHLRRESTISVMVISPAGNTLYKKQNVTYGEFAFTSTESGTYLKCFTLSENPYNESRFSVSLEWGVGVAAKDWKSVAKKEKIQGVELELRKLGDVVGAIHEKLIYLKSMEEDIREVSEKTNARVAWFSIVSLFVCIGASVLQLWYLNIFFHKNKLI